jgi:undecaprenyl-diphosphatase
MTDIIYSIDLSIFYFINHTLSNPIFDKFFPFITNVKSWYLAYIILWGILVSKGGKIGKIASIGIILLIATSDQLSSNLLKNLFERIRPCNFLDDVNVLVHCSRSYSFPSSHAVNNFAVAMYFYMIYPKLKWILFPVAFLVAFSRPYVGVHYPSDILAGGTFGVLVGYIFAIFTIYIDKKLRIKDKSKYENQT